MLFYILMEVTIGSGEAPVPAIGDDIHAAMSYEFCMDAAELLNRVQGDSQTIIYTCEPLKIGEPAGVK